PGGGGVEGAMKGVGTMPFPDRRNLVAEASCREPVEWPGEGPRTFVVIDCGVKLNIIREAQRHGRVIQLPYDATSDDIARYQPDGVIISNGPGDPAHSEVLGTTVKTAKEIAAAYSILRICLGYQILSIAFGASTYKLKFGHRGGNQPVKDLRTNRVHITSQNHGFAVDAKSMEASEVDVTQLNLTDGTVEGMIHKELPVFSVQYHPEAHPGPWDNKYIFREFAAMAGRCPGAEAAGPPDRPRDRFGSNRDRPGRGVRLLRVAGVPLPPGGGGPHGPRALESRHDPDRPRQ